jgi:hypothetical protein
LKIKISPSKESFSRILWSLFKDMFIGQLNRRIIIGY